MMRYNCYLINQHPIIMFNSATLLHTNELIDNADCLTEYMRVSAYHVSFELVLCAIGAIEYALIIEYATIDGFDITSDADAIFTRDNMRKCMLHELNGEEIINDCFKPFLQYVDDAISYYRPKRND